jgi:Ku70/Ku80 beta-barrel domain
VRVRGGLHASQWKGYLKLSLVSCPIALYSAISASERMSFRQVSKRTGNRLRHQLVDSVTGEAIERHDKGRGYEIGENEFAAPPLLAWATTLDHCLACKPLSEQDSGVGVVVGHEGQPRARMSADTASGPPRR